MLCAVIVALLAASVLADERQFHFSPEVGLGNGDAFQLSGDGPITAVRVWEHGSYIYGLQLRFGFIWSERIGSHVGSLQELELFDGESIVQMNGKFGHYINALQFVSSRGRLLLAGQHSGSSFNMYAHTPEARLVAISGRVRGPITAIAAHWGGAPSPDL